MKQGYIYKYTFPNGKVYIGQTKNLEGRHYGHMYDAKNRKTKCVVDYAIAKYGEPIQEVIETITVDDTELSTFQEKLNEAEKHWIKYYDATNKLKGYNIKEGGERDTQEEYFLQEAWYKKFRDEQWGESVAYFKYMLFECIRLKICETHESLNKEEKYIWYGYKFIDSFTNKETTFCGYYKRHKDDSFVYDIGDFDYDENGNLIEPANGAELENYLFNKVINMAIDDWVEDIRQTIWKQVMKDKDKILKSYKIS